MMPDELMPDTLMIEQVIEAARVSWSLGDAPISLVAARENRVYRVDGSDGPSALRLHRQGYRSNEEIHSELQWMEMLAANSMSVPKPIPAQDGTFVKTINGVVVDMLSWVDGVPLAKTEVTSDNYNELGCLLARMHKLHDQWELPSGFSRPTWDLVGEQPLWGRFWDNPGLTQEQRERFLQFRDTARSALDAMDQPDFGLIHADLVPDNILIDGKQLHLIDFDDGGFGHRLFDLATITHRSRRKNGNDELADATVAGYCTVRSLQCDALPLFEAMRACSYIGWNISRMDEAGGQERNARFIAEAETALEKFHRS